MYALTVQQPYASLIIAGLKTVETRKVHTTIRGRIAIHSSKQAPHLRRMLMQYRAFFEAHHLEQLSRFPLGVILGTVDLTNSVRVETLSPSVQEINFGYWARGHHAWLLENPEPFFRPRLWHGNTGFWKIEDAILTEDAILRANHDPNFTPPLLFSASA